MLGQGRTGLRPWRHGFERVRSSAYAVAVVGFAGAAFVFGKFAGADQGQDRRIDGAVTPAATDSHFQLGYRRVAVPGPLPSPLRVRSAGGRPLSEGLPPGRTACDVRDSRPACSEQRLRRRYREGRASGC